MPLSSSNFLARFKHIKAYLDEHPEASDDLKKGFAELAAAFKAAHSPEDFKKALAEDRPVGSDLEERVTSTLLLLTQERARRAGS
jgi:hypothetical protein